MDPLRYPCRMLLTRREAFWWDCLRDARQTEGQASRASPLPQICFHGAPPAELQGPWGGHSSRMGDTKPPNARPMGAGSQSWLSPKGTTPGMSPLPATTPRQERAPHGDQHYPSMPPTEAKWDHQPPARGFPSYIFPSPGGKVAHGAHSPRDRHPGVASSASCSPRRKRRAGAGEEEGRAWRKQHEKAKPLPIVPSCAMLEMSPWVPLLFPRPRAGKRGRTPLPTGLPRPLLISFLAKPNPLGFPGSVPSSAGRCQWCMLARESLGQRDRAQPSGSLQKGAIHSGCC